MNNSEKTPSKRIISIDVARGYAMFFYMGGAELFMEFARGTKSPKVISVMTRLMTHAIWHGITYADTLFPLFIFISGMTFPVSIAKRIKNGCKKSEIYQMVIRRCLILILLGMIYNGLLSDLTFSNLRYYSVLGRIGVAWLIAAVIFLNTDKTAIRIGWVALILVGYAVILGSFSAPDMPGYGNYTMEGNITGYIDRKLFPGHIYSDYYDPEGFLSTLASVATALSGMLTGAFLTKKDSVFSPKKKVICLMSIGFGMFVMGYLLRHIIPINKRLWTTSFNCVVIGMAIMTVTLFYLIIDVIRFDKWTVFFLPLGRNAIVAYLMFQMFGRFEDPSTFLFGGIAKLLPESYTPFVILLGGMIISYLIILLLYRSKKVIKIG